MARDQDEQIVHVVGAQPVEREPSRLDLASQQRQGLRQRMGAVEIGLPIRADQEQPHTARQSAHGAKQPHRDVVGPVHVVDNQHNRRRGRQPRQPLAHRILQPSGGRVGRNLRDVGEIRQHDAQRRRQRGEHRAVVSDRCPHDVGIGAARPRGDRLRERGRGDDVAVVTCTPQQFDAVDGMTGLRHQARLADPRFARHEHCAAVPAARHLEQLSNRSSLRGATDIRRTLPQPGARGRLPTDAPRLDRFGQTLQLNRAAAIEAVVAASARQQTYDIGDEDLAPGGGSTQARRLDDRCPETIAVFHAHVASGHADADHELDALTAAQQLGRLLDRNTGRDRVGRSGEHREQAVAEPLHYRTPVRGHCLGEGRVEFTSQRVRSRLTDLDADRRRRDQIRHEDRRGGRLDGHASPSATPRSRGVHPR